MSVVSKKYVQNKSRLSFWWSLVSWKSLGPLALVILLVTMEVSMQRTLLEDRLLISSYASSMNPAAGVTTEVIDSDSLPFKSRWGLHSRTHSTDEVSTSQQGPAIVQEPRSSSMTASAAAERLTSKNNIHVNHNNQQSLVVVQARAFDPWPQDRPLPCFPPDGIMVDHGPVMVPHNHPVRRGFFFLKTFKTASSTSAGVNLRIARNVAARLKQQKKNKDKDDDDDDNNNNNNNNNNEDQDDHSFDFCRSRFDHGKPWFRNGSLLFGNRRIGESFLWAILRHPTSRAVSWYFHMWVSRKNAPATMERFLEGMQVDKKNYYIRSMALQDFKEDEHDGIMMANEIIQGYDFIGVSERLDESFVALAMLLRIPLSDVLYLSAKQNGSYDEHCFFIEPTVVTPEMQTFLESDEWKETIREDLALYEAANQSLDMTIERLGRDTFERNLATYKMALAEGQKRCGDTTVFPCTKDGQRVHPSETDCLWTDSGCGATCLDAVAADLKLEEEFFGSTAY